MTCSGMYQAPIVRSPVPGETHGKTTLAWTPCQLRRAHPCPCGPRLAPGETFDDRQAAADMIERERTG